MKRVVLIAIVVSGAALRLLWLDSLPAVVTNHEATVAVHAWRGNFRLWWVGEEIVSPVPWLLATASLKLFGLSTFALRLPIALAGILSVYLLYRLARRWFNENGALVAAAILALAPWHVHLSRFFIEEVILLAAVLALLVGVAERRMWATSIAVVAVIFSSWHWLDRLRVAMVDGVALWFLNIFKYLSFDWLFFRGDKYVLHGIGDLGQLYTLLIPFFLIGLFVCWERKIGRVVLLLTAVFVAAASLSRFSPEARASLLAAPWIMLIIGTGADRSVSWTRKKLPRVFPLIALVFGAVALYQVISYVHFYTVHFGKRSGSEWSFVYKQVAPFVAGVYDQYDQIVVSSHYGAAAEQMMFHAPGDSPIKSGEAVKIHYGTPEKLDAIGPNTLLVLEQHLKPGNAVKLKEFRLANDITAMVAWETQR